MTRNISDEIGGVFKRLDGVSVSVDVDRCIGCGSCYEICFTKAISLVDGKCSLDPGMCRGYGRCVETCPTDCITLEFDGSVVDREVDRIHSLVNLCSCFRRSGYRHDVSDQHVSDDDRGDDRLDKSQCVHHPIIDDLRYHVRRGSTDDHGEGQCRIAGIEF